MEKTGKITIENISKTDIADLREQGVLIEGEDLWTYLFCLTLTTEMMKKENKEKTKEK